LGVSPQKKSGVGLYAVVFLAVILSEVEGRLKKAAASPRESFEQSLAQKNLLIKINKQVFLYQTPIII
jgi:hypothetical protein